MRGRLRVDCTTFSCVIVCADCPSWSALTSTRVEAWRAGREHELRAHPGSKQADRMLGYLLAKAS